MTEVELKILLPDATAARAAARAPGVLALAEWPARRTTLRSVYLDAPGRPLRAAGIALRLRKVGRGWVQTVKRAPGAAASGGLFAMEEDERPAPGGRLDLSRIGDDGLRAAVEAALGDAVPSPLFETAIRRTILDLSTPEGRVEMAVDVGEIIAGEARADLFEVEFELKSGDPTALYTAARAALGTGAWRFSGRSKAARGHALADGARPLPTGAPRRARAVAPARGDTAEAVAIVTLRETLGQVDANMAACLAGPEPEGPHQLRVGLRRFRSALDLHRGAVGGAPAADLGARARDLARRVGTLRDLDVQIEEVLRPAAEGDGPDADGCARLAAALADRREAARADVRALLTGAEGRSLLLDLSAFVELRGWLDPADHGQTERLSRPAEAAAAEALDRRWRKVRKAARNLETADAEARHALRKELKKLRYGVDFLGPLFKGRRVKPFRKATKALQAAFGALNDAAVAEAMFAGPDAPCADDPLAQRAAGRLLGALDRAAAAERTRAIEDWRALSITRPFWR